MSTRARQGDTTARDELVHANLRFVVDVAKQYQYRGLPLGDLIGAGNVGLVTAAERFDGGKGLKFISYAVWWIRQAILMELAENERTVRLPPRQRDLLRGIATASRRLAQRHGREPADEELAVELDVRVDEVAAARRHGRAVWSLDEPLHSDAKAGSLLRDTLVDLDQEPPDAQALRESSLRQLRLRLETLDERELHILYLHYGLDGSEGLTLRQISLQIGLTRERVRQLRNRALHKLRRPPRRPGPTGTAPVDLCLEA